MKQIKFLFLLSCLLLTQAITANPFSYMNPLAWIRGLQRVYYRNDLKAQNKRLEELYAQRIELENFKKMYAVVTAPLPQTMLASKSTEDIRYISDLEITGDTLNDAFYDRYQKNLKLLSYYHISRIRDFVDDKFTPELKKAAKDSYTTVQQLPKSSWYEQLKEKEAKLPAKEKQKNSNQRQAEFKAWQIEHSWYKKLREQEINLPAEVKVKTAVQRREEFKDWQLEYNQKNASGIERKAFFRNWRINNPNYYQTDFNKI